MSGVVITFDPLGRKQETEELITQMCQALQRSDREGPIERYSRPNLAMGRCRPVLINQSPQPAWNEDKTICAFFHGELFGHQDLRRRLQRDGHRFSDGSHAEFVIHLYEDSGDAFIHQLNGCFALALWDGRQQKLMIANDRYGLRPLYTAHYGGRSVWASAPKAILADTAFSKQINLAAMADHLCLSIPQSNDTMFEGIEELPPASLVTCRYGQVRCQQYWDLTLQDEETGISSSDCLDELIPLLKQAAERKQNGELSLGLLLSGGLDSRVALSVLKTADLKTFTYGNPLSEDVQFACQVAKTANVSHLVLEIEPDFLETYAQVGLGRLEELINCDRFHGISVYDEISAHVNALTTGTAADWILGRFRYDPNDPFWADDFSVDRYYDSLSIMTDEELKQLVKPHYFQHMKGLTRARFHRDFEKCPSRHTTSKVDYWEVRQYHRRLVNRPASLFPSNLEYRPLFYDKDLVDFALTIPPSLRWGEDSVYRQIIFRTAPELGKIAATTTRGLPLDATHTQMVRHKGRLKRLDNWRRMTKRICSSLIPPSSPTRYVNYPEWLKQELRGWTKSILLDPRTLNRDYWNGLDIRRLLEDYLGSKQGSKKLARQITALISFELWHRMYLDT